MVILDGQKIWKSLGGRIVLRGASLTVEEGERIVILGENGSGKSTLLHVLSGVLDPDYGNVNVAGTIGFAAEKPDIPDHLLVGAWLDVIASLKGLRHTPPVGLGVDELRRKMASSLSLGQRQRLCLATAWMGNPSILVLDEPTNALDAGTRAEIVERLMTGTSILATHDPEIAARVATRVLTVRGGLVC